jgi:hypothetical protein
MIPLSVRRSSARLTGPLAVRCPCGGLMRAPDATEPLSCPVCGQRWRARLVLREVTAELAPFADAGPDVPRDAASSDGSHPPG